MPKSFQSSVKASDNSYYIYHEGAHSLQDAQDYLFDKTILCEACDNTFSPAEKYTAGFFEGIRTGELLPVKEYIHESGDKDYFYQPDLFLLKNLFVIDFMANEYFYHPAIPFSRIRTLSSFIKSTAK